MEQNRKIDGESSRTEDVMNKDIISELPEALLLHILSYVPTKDIIATSVLSKRWRSVWKMVSKLSFDTDIDHFSTEDVYRLLILHKAPFLESLYLYIHNTSARLNIGFVIGIAFSRHVRELVMVLFHEDQTRVRFPSVLCSYNNTLEVLNLSQDLLLDFPSRVCFSALRELHLCLVIFKDEASVCNLLSGCPRLQDLVVVRIGNSDVGTYTIDVPSLQRLTLQVDGSHNRSGGGGGYVINTPSLKYLNMECLYCIDFCLIENAPELVEAKINHVSDIDNENILASLTSAKRLSFLPLYLPLEIKYPTGSIFYQLVSLELHIHKINGWNLLSFMLDSSPKLQILKLIGRYREECPVGWEWNQPKRVPECLLLHLETLVWTRYGWQREDEKQVATYILKNARQLKKASFPMEQEELEKSREMLNGLASLDRGSTSCHLVFE
ncbi:FBD-associated F-box protein [Raphanus sativus]|uniref:FBD-associated F-box protein At3g49020-like n=1 Tax=Raphanus sativus TaxID=3726 RepID=A0A9W3CQQ4_RAPSA|nr:FBD-associated F-box protein At3g49020-like [Raphanus sativus]XP_056863726.1 FBD-associated F-box protein At3g49020-like isoform X1 [Raphanus sativus]KAJ4870742.1 FBD-associated F-box protein [Raphanus sativus]